VSQDVLSFRPVPDVGRSSGRGVGFLEGHTELNAWAAFEGLGVKQKRDLKTFRGEWVIGKDKPKSRFHGWPDDDECDMCFVFKAKERNKNHRFYGYLCNPLPKTNSPFRLCVLCIHALKNERESDRSELLRVRVWYESATAQEAVKEVFTDQLTIPHVARDSKWKM
jgi:hypothetical protein